MSKPAPGESDPRRTWNMLRLYQVTATKKTTSTRRGNPVTAARAAGGSRPKNSVALGGGRRRAGAPAVRLAAPCGAWRSISATGFSQLRLESLEVVAADLVGKPVVN